MKKFDKKSLMIPMVVLTTIIVVFMLVRSIKASEVNMGDMSAGIVSREAAMEGVLPDNDKIIDTTSYESLLQAAENIMQSAKVYAINVDGADVALLKDRASAEAVLERLKEPYVESAEEGMTTTFAENVSIAERVMASGELDKIQGPEEVYSSITKENETTRIYVVQAGDTVSQVAEKLGVKQKDLEKANPDLDVDRISIGQELMLTVPRYVINIKQSVVKEYEDSVPYDIEYEESDALYKGNTEVKVEGVEGRKQVKAELISINGFPEETRVINEVILTEPKSAIVLKGTKPRPRTLAYGVFNWPSRGSITSRFGARWGEQHSGIDIAAPKGSSNKAADGGVVTFAGWSGNYGKLVIIDHENGYTTYYGHNDTIKVKKGQRVARGEVIGTVGETGRATGPHLHFEVRKNGVAVNPLKYIN